MASSQAPLNILQRWKSWSTALQTGQLHNIRSPKGLQENPTSLAAGKFLITLVTSGVSVWFRSSSNDLFWAAPVSHHRWVGNCLPVLSHLMVWQNPFDTNKMFCSIVSHPCFCFSYRHIHSSNVPQANKATIWHISTNSSQGQFLYPKAQESNTVIHWWKPHCTEGKSWNRVQLCPIHTAPDPHGLFCPHEGWPMWLIWVKPHGIKRWKFTD